MRVFVCHLLGVLLSVPVWAAGVEPGARTTVGESVGVIEKRDLLRVTVSELAGPGKLTERWVRVDGKGEVRLPYLKGQRVAGLTTAAAEREIAKAYRESSIVPQTVVDVRRLEAGSRVKEEVGGMIAAGDLLEIGVQDLAGPGEETVVEARVGGDSKVGLPIVGPFSVAGMTEAEAEAAVAKVYREKGLIARPVVSLRVVEPEGRSAVALRPVGKGDLVRVSIVELGGATRWGPMKVRVGQDGGVPLPMVGAVKVEGLGEAQAGAAVAQAYRDANLMRMAIVGLRRVEGAEKADVKLGAIEAGEVLRVGVWELAGPAGGAVWKVLKVDEKGEVSPAMLKGVKVAGLSEGEAVKAIAKAYREQGILPAAQVAVLKVNGGGAWEDEEMMPAEAPGRGKAEGTHARR